MLPFLVSGVASAQILEPVKLSTSVERDGDQATLILTAKIEDGWHMYSQFLSSDDGPAATELTFAESAEYSLEGKAEEEDVLTHFDEMFEMDVNYFDHQAVFKQKIKVSNESAFKVKGTIYYMVCDDGRCLPPEEFDVVYNVPSATGELPADDAGETGDAAGAGHNNAILDPVKWTFASTQEGEEYVISMSATVEEGWHLYSQHLESDEGPIATSFYWDPNDKVEAVGVVEEEEYHTEYDPNFEMDLNFFEGTTTFRQKFKVVGDAIPEVTGVVNYMVCDDARCLPPKDIFYKIDLATGVGAEYDPYDTVEVSDETESLIIPIPGKNFSIENPVSACTETDDVSGESAWVVFVLGFLGGLAALFTPCVFPMIPLTVSFFTKGSQEKKKGFMRAFMYGFFIFVIYISLSIPFHFNSDPEILNQISTSWWLNILFFVIFVFFAGSFFGYYELTLPSKWGNRMDSKADIGGFFGIFFMALTLAIVSFSCTGPILGSVLAGSLKDGPWPITAAMAGFGVALGLPFALFAAFPSVMNKLPQSGGWLNSVKVVLGFLELGLALKFLSNADLVQNWGILHRETFYLVWILLGIGLTAYLFGWIKFPHDSPLKKLGIFRIGFATLVAAFTIYLVPGLLGTKWWGQNLVSGFPPPYFYSWYDVEMGHFTDYETALAYAKEQNKPVLIDFTGWACVNCRKMEENVWIDEGVEKIIEEDYVLVSLYVDEDIALPEEKQGIVEVPTADGGKKKKKIKTVGNKWATFEAVHFQQSAQPYYFLLSPEGELLTNGVGYTPDIEEYKAFLECGLDAYEKSKGGSEVSEVH